MITIQYIQIYIIIRQNQVHKTHPQTQTITKHGQHNTKTKTRKHKHAYTTQQYKTNKHTIIIITMIKNTIKNQHNITNTTNTKYNLYTSILQNENTDTAHGTGIKTNMNHQTTITQIKTKQRLDNIQQMNI